MAKVEKKAQAQTQAQVNKAGVPVNTLEFLRAMHLDWVLERPLEEGDIDHLKAKVVAHDNGEWVSWWIPYTRIDGAPVKGLSWGASAPAGGRYLVLRLVESGEVKATLRIYSTGKGILTGSEPVVKALLGRKDLRPWSDDDLAALL
jgi:hypothetical protein